MNPEQTQRYNRHLILEDWTTAQQEKILQTKLLYIGAGGLGCATLPLLSAAGIGHITVMDSDRIELSNLQRQLAYTEQQINQSKVTALKGYLTARNSDVHINSIQEFFTEQQAFILKDYDIVAIGTDTASSRYLVNKFAKQYNKPAIIASVSRTTAHIFAMQHNTVAPCYNCLFPDGSKGNNRGIVGVLNVMVAIAGAQQAAEILHYARYNKFEHPNRLKQITLDDIKIFDVQKNSTCAICGDVGIC